jgi:hypothetical protein
MTSTLIRTISFAAALAITAPLAAAGKGKPAPLPAPAPCDALIAYMDTLPTDSLSDAEKAGLQFTREEEKLARDVYIALAAEWGHRSFTNIAAAEQAHMDAVKFLLDRYAVPDPAEGKALGVFSDIQLQTLYTSLLENGLSSLPNALATGATIEDMDIFDSVRLLAQSDNADIDALYQNLAKGSRNHLRSFASQLDANGATYVPQFISAADFEAIVTTPLETQVLYDASGEPVEIPAGTCGGKGPRR